MKAVRGLTLRMIVASMVCGIVGQLASQAIGRGIARTALARLSAPLAKYLFHTYEKERCEEAPISWSLALDNGARVYAYDRATLLSLNPKAPPLNLALRNEALRGGDPFVVVDWRGFMSSVGGTWLLDDLSDGPCGIVQATWPAQRIGRNVLLLVSMGTLVSAASAAMLALLSVVRPLIRRIEALRLAAERVGSASDYLPCPPTADELGQLAGALDRAHARIRADAGRLEQRGRDLQRHLADVAHDLKTPISSLHIALEQVADANNEPELTELLTSALNDTVYLGALTSNLRLASALREGWDPAAARATVDLAETVDRVARRAGFFARRKGITLECAVPDDPTFAACDPIAAEQALSNIVENAVTHGSPGGHVAMMLEAREGTFSLAVIDDGPGVPPSDLPRIGERTFRTDDARQRDPRGTGLGLAITTEVCAMCGWTIQFESETPRGLRVTLTGSTIRPHGH
jgi:signal transduction histidine kinase